MTEKAVEQVIFESWSKSFSESAGGDMNDYRDYILERVKFADVMKALKLRPEKSSTGKYTHRMVCPFKFHKNGRERTGSFRFSDKKGSFICFGCGVSGNILMFLGIYVGGDEQFNLKKLATIAGLTNDVGAWTISDKNNIVEEQETKYNTEIEAGIVLRNYLIGFVGHNKYEIECNWVDEVLIEMDKSFAKLDEYDVDSAKKVLNSINDLVKDRAKTSSYGIIR